MGAPSHGLNTLRRLTVNRRKADEAWRAGIRDAVGYGNSHRAVAESAGVSHTRVQQILREP